MKRRKLERLAKKQGKEEPIYKMEVQLIQPWSVPIFKTTLPPDVLQTMIEISDQVITDKETKSHGEYLAGQIDTELLVEHDILERTGVVSFLLGVVRQFVITCKCQMMPGFEQVIQKEEWVIQMLSMWSVSQQPGEYNPIHTHTGCDVSSVMYLKVPKMLPSRKEHKHTQGDFIDTQFGGSADGSILFTSNASRDIGLSNANIRIPPQVGDFYIFGANQQHAVYPYRCEEGQEDVERRSISFNAAFQSKAEYDRGLTNPSTVKPTKE